MKKVGEKWQEQERVRQAQEQEGGSRQAQEVETYIDDDYEYNDDY